MFIDIFHCVTGANHFLSVWNRRQVTHHSPTKTVRWYELYAEYSPSYYMVPVYNFLGVKKKEKSKSKVGTMLRYFLLDICLKLQIANHLLVNLDSVYAIIAFAAFLSIFPLSNLINVNLRKIIQSKWYFTWMFWIFVPLIHSRARWYQCMYVNWIILVFVKCPTHGMSLLCYLNWLLEWWEVDRTHVITCKILVEANGSTIITPSTSCSHILFPGNLRHSLVHS